METNAYPTHPMATTAPRPRVQEAFAALRRSTAVYGALSALALIAVASVAAEGHTVTTFMWVRAVLLPVVALLVHRLAASASRGSGRAVERVRAVTTVMPVAIIGIDLIPGVCPPWHAAMQALCMLPVIRAALLTRFSVPRAISAEAH